MLGVLGFPSFQASLKTLSGVEFRWMWKKVHNGRHSLVFFGLQVVKQSDLGHLGSLSCCSINPFPQVWGVWLERDFSLVCMELIWCRSPSVAKHTQILNIPTTKFHCGFTLVSFCLLYISFYAWLHIFFFLFFSSLILFKCCDMLAHLNPPQASGLSSPSGLELLLIFSLWENFYWCILLISSSTNIF